MKHFLLIYLAIAMCITICACGSDKEKELVGVLESESEDISTFYDDGTGTWSENLEDDASVENVESVFVTSDYVESISLPSSNEFDEVLVYGNGYFVVKKTVDNFEGAYDTVGVVDEEGKWIQPLSQEHPFIIKEADREFARSYNWMYKKDIGLAFDSEYYTYLGDSMFAVEIEQSNAIETRNEHPMFRIYDAETGIGYNAGELYSLKHIDNGFEDGIMFASCDFRLDGPFRRTGSELKILTKEKVIYTGIECYTKPDVSEGVFFIKSEKCFFNLEGEKVIDLAEYTINNTPKFENNKAYIEFKNNAGSIYHTEIDKNGNFLYDPIKLD